MKNQILIAAAVLFIYFLISSPPLQSQTRVSFTKTALSKMDVLSRAELFENEIADAARKEGVDPNILWTIAYNETRFRPWLTSPKNARGLMQFIPATASRFGLSDPYEPSSSIRAAARYVKHLSRLFGSRLDSVLAAYNSGEGTVFAYLNGRTLSANGKRINPTGMRTAGGVPPYRETTDYVANGKRIHRWLLAQGKFSRAPDNAPAASQEPKFSTDTNATASAGVLVLYDPRSGNRYLVGGGAKLQQIKQTGAVIVAPEVRSLPAQKARSTFALITP